MTKQMTTSEMTPCQSGTFRRFIEFVKERNHEVKRLKVEDSYGDAYVFVEVGLKDDEGTMAEIICRDTYLFFIGRRGGIYQYSDEGYSKIYRKYHNVRPMKC